MHLLPVLSTNLYPSSSSCQRLSVVRPSVPPFVRVRRKRRSRLLFLSFRFPTHRDLGALLLLLLLDHPSLRPREQEKKGGGGRGAVSSPSFFGWGLSSSTAKKGTGRKKIQTSPPSPLFLHERGRKWEGEGWWALKCRLPPSPFPRQGPPSSSLASRLKSRMGRMEEGRGKTKEKRDGQISCCIQMFT